MTKLELRASKSALEVERNKLNEKLTNIRDRKIIAGEKLQGLRNEEFQHLEGIKALTASESNKIAKKVLNDKIVQVRIDIEDAQKAWETVNNEFLGMEGKVKNLEKAIKELSTA